MSLRFSCGNMLATVSTRSGGKLCRLRAARPDMAAWEEPLVEDGELEGEEKKK